MIPHSSRCSISSTRTSSTRARSPSCLTTTAVRVSAVCALFTSTVHLMVRRSVVLLPVSSTCVASTMVMSSPLNLGALLPSLLSRTVWLTVTPSIRLSRLVATLPSAPVRLRTPMPSSFLRRMPTRQWTALLASVVVLA